MCIRDDTGNFVKAKTIRSISVCALDIGEASGLSHTIQWVHELQFPNVDFELDAKRVVDYFNSGSNGILEFGATLDDRKRRCNFFFKTLKLSLVIDK